MSIKIFAAGDIVNNTGNPNFVDKKLNAIIQNHDISFCNFEAPVETTGNKIIKAGPHLFQDKSSVRYTKEMGFNLFSLANNHIYDYGEIGLKNTLNEIKKEKIHYVGAGLNYEEAYNPLIITINKTKIGFIAAAEAQFGCLTEDNNKSGYAWINNNKIEKTILSLKNRVDIIILSSHAGAESTYVPLPEWRDRYKYLCDIGVDLLLGHHPHVPQGYEKHVNSYIFYSLGNFYFDTANHEKSSNDSYSLSINIDDNKIIDINFIYHKNINNQTTLVEKKDVNFSIKELIDILTIDYENHVTKLVISYFKSFYHGYYKTALSKELDNMTIAEATLLLHNIKIDSHRYVVQRALEKLYGR